MYEFGGFNGVKKHYCSEWELADAVAEDLFNRFGRTTDKQNFTYRDGELCRWDPGGMLVANQPQFELELGRITLLVDIQHWNDFAGQFKRRKKAGPRTARGIKYYKFHCQFWCTCLTEAQFNKLDQIIVKEGENFSQAADAWFDSSFPPLKT